MLTALKEYLIGSWKEFRKVQWPKPKEAWRYSLIVVFVSAAVTTFIAAVDWIFGGVIDFIP